MRRVFNCNIYAALLNQKVAVPLTLKILLWKNEFFEKIVFKNLIPLPTFGPSDPKSHLQDSKILPCFQLACDIFFNRMQLSSVVYLVNILEYQKM